MTDFINDAFLLRSSKAVSLYNDYARDLPIVDYHCHLSPQEIAEDKRFDSITSIWLGGDHYKWRLMRACGIEEKYITGDASDKEKFCAWAKAIGSAWGNPLYHWTSLELARYFGINNPLTEDNAEEIWEKTNKILSETDMTPSYFFEKSKVELVCTTDDPTDDLSWHKKIKEDGKIATRVLPTFRPDPALEVSFPGFISYCSRLGEAAGIKINSLAALKEALSSRMEHFASMGCLLADHGTETIPYKILPEAVLENAFARRINGEMISSEEADAIKTDLLLFCAEQYCKRGWTMQFHFGCRRDNNEAMLKKLGVNIGCDTIAGSFDLVTPLAQIMSNLENKDSLPKMILYSLDPVCNAQLDTLIGCFQKGPDVMKIQHGSAWWFNDNLEGIKDQMRNLALQSYFPGFIGMLTDSRSFLSYPRHEYFRRILCNMLAESVNKGLFPDDDKILGKIIRNICHDNAAAYFKEK